jgi:hypothetical protein
MKKKCKIAVDVLMLGLFIYLINFNAGMGLLLHAVLGLVLYAVFILHHILNASWYRALSKGKYSFRRRMLAVIDFLLAAAMLGMMFSSLMISGMVFRFSPIPIRFEWRKIHVLSSGWGVLLMALHLGFHLDSVLVRFGRFLGKTNFAYAWVFTEMLAAAAGIGCLVRTRLWGNLTAQDNAAALPASDPVQFLLTGFSILGICLVVHFLLHFFTKRKFL